MVAWAEVVCDPKGEEKDGRIMAYCAVEGRDLGEVQVQAGLALAHGRYSYRYLTT